MHCYKEVKRFTRQTSWISIVHAQELVRSNKNAFYIYIYTHTAHIFEKLQEMSCVLY